MQYDGLGILTGWVVAQCAWAISEVDAGGGPIPFNGLGVPTGRVHKSVVLSFPPSNMILLSYQTVHLCLLKCTLQPASVKTLIPNSNAIDRSRMWPVRIVGRPMMCMLHSCVKNTMRPSGRATLSGDCVTRLFTTGVFSVMNICVAPESAIASFVFWVTLTAARACVATDWVVAFDDKVEVIMVTMSSAQPSVVVAEHRVRYNVLLAELT